MQIAVMVGSLRKDSFNRKVYENYQRLHSDKFHFTEINTADFPHYNSDLEDSKPECIDRYGQQLSESSGMLFFTPEYNYSIPGHLKNAIDWLSRVSPNPFNNKKAAILGASPGGMGTGRMQYDLRKVGVFLNLHFLNKPEFMLSNVMSKFDEEGNLDSQTIDFLDKHGKAYQAYLAH